MKLACPKCARGLALADDRVPPGGGWASCPRCGERFFLHPPGQGIKDQPPPAIIREGGEREELLRRLRARSTEPAPHPPGEASHAWEEEVTIFPRRAWTTEASALAGMVILLGVSLSILLLFRDSVRRFEAPPPSPVSARPDNDRGAGAARRDVEALRRASIGRSHLWAVVDFRGMESRIFKYFRSRLGLDEFCPQLYRLELRSEAPAEGLSFIGTCLDENGRLLGRPLELNLKWRGNWAQAGFTGFRGVEELDLSPPAAEP